MRLAQQLTVYMELNVKCLLVGPPGIAKTALVKEAAAHCKRRLISRRMSLAERVDLSGALVPDLKAGVTRALPLDLLHDLRTTEEPTLFFPDDIGQAPIDVQASLMLLFDEGELSPNVLIWGATNRPGDKAGVIALCEPLRSRFDIAFAMPTPDEQESASQGATVLGKWVHTGDINRCNGCFVCGWMDWAMDYGAPHEVIAWHRSTHGEHLYGWKPIANPAVRMPDLRAWKTVIDLMNGGIADQMSISAAIGHKDAREFLAFAALSADLPTVDSVKMDPENAKVPPASEPAALYLVTSMLAKAAHKSWIDSLLIYLNRLPRVYGALLGRDIHRRIGASMTGSKHWQKWYLENAELFETGS